MNNKMELDSGLPILIGKTIKVIKVENGELWIGFEDGTFVTLSKDTIQADTDGWID